jgi:pantoate--beta-alanine ligase
MTAGPPVIEACRTIRPQILAAQAAGRRVGIVPTMGSLHAGHTSLVEQALAECDDVVVSIFVNPTQFGPHEDFDRYPRNLAADCDLLSRHRVRWVFAPDKSELYPPGHATRVEVTGPAEPFEGRLRPGHFSGVATVVCRLMQAVPANAAYFGAKDWQQTLVIRRMVADLGLPVEVVVCPTVREPDGLALSSRNAYLTPPQRQRARALSIALEQARADWQADRPVTAITAGMTASLEAAGITVDYADVVAAETLEPLEDLPPETPAIALIAGRLGETRLIDNLLLPPRGDTAC